MQGPPTVPRIWGCAGRGKNRRSVNDLEVTEHNESTRYLHFLNNFSCCPFNTIKFPHESLLGQTGWRFSAAFSSFEGSKNEKRVSADTAEIEKGWCQSLATPQQPLRLPSAEGTQPLRLSQQSKTIQIEKGGPALSSPIVLQVEVKWRSSPIAKLTRWIISFGKQLANRGWHGHCKRSVNITSTREKYLRRAWMCFCQNKTSLLERPFKILQHPILRVWFFYDTDQLWNMIM